MVYVSDSFDFNKLNEPWPRVENENPDLYADMAADRFRIGVPTKPEFARGEQLFIWDDRPDVWQASSPSDVMNLHPHYNEHGQMDAIILDYSESYATIAGLYRYNIRQLDMEDNHPTFNYYKKGGLYELTPKNLDFYRASDDEAIYIIEDTETGFVDILSPDIASENFINDYLFKSEMHENKGTSYYLVPSKQKGSYSIYEYHNVDEVLKVADLSNDGKVTFVDAPFRYNHAPDFAYNFDKITPLGQLKTHSDKYFNMLDDKSKQIVAEAVAKQNLEFKQSNLERYTMDFVNSKGWQKEMIICSKKIKNHEDAIAYANNLIETWRGGKEDSRVKLLKLSTVIKDQYDVSGHKAVKINGEVLIDNLCLEDSDFVDLDDSLKI